MDAWWRTDPYQPMKRFFLTALLGLAAMMAVAAGFRTVRLAEIARAVSLPTKAMEGSTDSIFFRNRPLRICYNQTGDIAHIGYKIFSDPQLEYAAPRPLLIYLERYLLETQIPHLNDRLVYAEEVKVREGKINMLFRVKDDTPIGVEEKQRKMYRITFGMTEGENLVLDVKCNSQFMLGADIVELERNMMRDLPRFPQTLTAEDWSAEATTRIDDNLLICREAAFLDKDIRPVSEIEDQRPINQHWSWDKILRSPFIKQADVLQGIYFLNDEYTMEQKEKNFDFYEPLTVHESSLSPCIHSILAAELGKQKKAVELYQRTARLDLDNYNNDTVDGLHITSMSGSWLAIVQGFAGMRYDHDQLKFNPFVPEGWDHYSFKINYRGRLIEVYVDHEGTKLTLLKGEDIDVLVHDKKVTLKEGETTNA